MRPDQLEAYLHANIPLTRAMAVAVEACSPDAIVLTAPLAPNINHRQTLFGGSGSALTILAAWSLLHLRLLDAGRTTRIVIQRNSMEYLLPVDTDVRIISRYDGDAASWTTFLAMLDRRGRARTTLTATLEADGAVAGRLEADFVALGTAS